MFGCKFTMQNSPKCVKNAIKWKKFSNFELMNNDMMVQQLFTLNYKVHLHLTRGNLHAVEYNLMIPLHHHSVVRVSFRKSWFHRLRIIFSCTYFDLRQTDLFIALVKFPIVRMSNEISEEMYWRRTRAFRIANDFSVSSFFLMDFAFDFSWIFLSLLFQMFLIDSCDALVCYSFA